MRSRSASLPVSKYFSGTAGTSNHHCHSGSPSTACRACRPATAPSTKRLAGFWCGLPSAVYSAARLFSSDRLESQLNKHTHRFRVVTSKGATGDLPPNLSNHSFFHSQKASRNTSVSIAVKAKSETSLLILLVVFFNCDLNLNR